jgi:hypothetical protein
LPSQFLAMDEEVFVSGMAWSFGLFSRTVCFPIALRTS